MIQAEMQAQKECKNDMGFRIADADVVLFVHRQEVLDPDTELKGVTELIIAKDRHNDGNGTVYLTKCSGGFKEISEQEVAEMKNREKTKNQPPQRGKKKR